MILKEAIISTFIIERKGQIKLFQVKIPAEVKNIIGVRLGVRFIGGDPTLESEPLPWVLPMIFRRNILLGDFKLQSYDSSNVFYTSELAMNANVNYADFTSAFFLPNPYTHQYASSEDVVGVSGRSTILQGVYRDKLADQQGGDYSYSVSVYVWGEGKEQPKL